MDFNNYFVTLIRNYFEREITESFYRMIMQALITLKIKEKIENEYHLDLEDREKAKYNRKSATELVDDFIIKKYRENLIKRLQVAEIGIKEEIESGNFIDTEINIKKEIESGRFTRAALLYDEYQPRINSILKAYNKVRPMHI